MKLTREQFNALAWAAMFTEANIEGYGSSDTGARLYVGSNVSSCVRWIRGDSERFVIGPDKKPHLAGGMVPTAEFKRLFAQRLRRLGFIIK